MDLDITRVKMKEFVKFAKLVNSVIQLQQQELNMKAMIRIVLKAIIAIKELNMIH